jgi:hypothetical protein
MDPQSMARSGWADSAERAKIAIRRFKILAAGLEGRRNLPKIPDADSANRAS